MPLSPGGIAAYPAPGQAELSQPTGSFTRCRCLPNTPATLGTPDDACLRRKRPGLTRIPSSLNQATAGL